MKRILPKGIVGVRGIPSLPHVVPSPQTTTFILTSPMASTINLPPTKTGSIILPSPPMSTITLTAHSVPQPSPVMLPLTTTTTTKLPSNSAHRCSGSPQKRIHPKSAMESEKDPLSSSGKRSQHSRKHASKKIKPKGSKSSVVAILPKAPQMESKSLVIFPPAVALEEMSEVSSHFVASPVCHVESTISKPQEKISKRTGVRKLKLKFENEDAAKSQGISNSDGTVNNNVIPKECGKNERSDIRQGTATVGNLPKEESGWNKNQSDVQKQIYPTTPVYSCTSTTSSLVQPTVPSSLENRFIEHTIPQHPPPPYPQFAHEKTNQIDAMGSSLDGNSMIIPLSKDKNQKSLHASKKLSDQHYKGPHSTSSSDGDAVPEKNMTDESSLNKIVLEKPTTQLASSQAYADTFFRNNYSGTSQTDSVNSILAMNEKPSVTKSVTASSYLTKMAQSCSSPCKKTQDLYRDAIKTYPGIRDVSPNQSSSPLVTSACSTQLHSSHSKAQNYELGYYSMPSTPSTDIVPSLMPSTPSVTSFSFTHDNPLSSETTMTHSHSSYTYSPYSDVQVNDLGSHASHHIASQQHRSLFSQVPEHESFDQSLHETLASVLPVSDPYIPPVHTILYPKPSPHPSDQFSHSTLKTRSPDLSPSTNFPHSDTPKPPHPSTDVQGNCMRPDQSSLYPESKQLPSYSQSPHSSSHNQPSHQPLHAQSSHPSPFLESSQPVMTVPLQDVYSMSSQANIDSLTPQLSSYTPTQQPDSCLHTNHQSPYLESSQAVADSVLVQHTVSVAEPNNTRTIPFSAGCTPSYCESPQAEALVQSPHNTATQSDHLLSRNLFRDDSLSPHHSSGPVPQIMQPHHYAESPVSYNAHQVDSASDFHYYNTVENRPFTASLFGTEGNFSVRSLEKTLSPPSYESHLQCTAEYIASISSAGNSHSDIAVGHQETPPSNFPHPCHSFKQDVSASHTVSKKDIGAPPAYPSSSSLHTHPPSPPTYSFNQHMSSTHQLLEHSVVGESTVKSLPNYYLKESSHQYLSTTSPVEAQSNIGHHTNAHKFCHTVGQGSSSPAGFTVNCIATQEMDQSSSFKNQEKSYLSTDQDASTESNKQKDYPELLWNNSEREESVDNSDSLKFHSLIERAENVWFIPSQEQNRVYTKRKELARRLLNHPDMHTRRDSMLKEKFWIEEDEPISEEIMVSSQETKEEEEQDWREVKGNEVVPDHNANLPAHINPKGPKPKTSAKREMLCQVCGKILKGRSSLRCHLNSHRNIQPHVCVYCTKAFTNRSVLAEHIRTHTGEKPFVCAVCEAAFKSRSGLVRHKHIHSDVRPFECSMCSKRFKTKLVLQQHMKLHLTGLFTCPVCGETFQQHKSLAAHKAYHHHRSQRYICPHCHKGYYYRSLLTRHMQVHSNIRKHVCSVCNEAFVWRSGFVAHMKTHSASRPQCDVCGKRFASEKRLKTHTLRHTNSKPHQCKICGRSFSHAYRLVSHSQTHEENKDYSCSKCGVLCASTKKLRKHLATHRKEMPSS